MERKRIARWLGRNREERRNARSCNVLATIRHDNLFVADHTSISKLRKLLHVLYSSLDGRFVLRQCQHDFSTIHFVQRPEPDVTGDRDGRGENLTAKE